MNTLLGGHRRLFLVKFAIAGSSAEPQSGLTYIYH